MSYPITRSQFKIKSNGILSTNNLSNESPLPNNVNKNKNSVALNSNSSGGSSIRLSSASYRAPVRALMAHPTVSVPPTPRHIIRPTSLGSLGRSTSAVGSTTASRTLRSQADPTTLRIRLNSTALSGSNPAPVSLSSTMTNRPPHQASGSKGIPRVTSSKVANFNGKRTTAEEKRAVLVTSGSGNCIEIKSKTDKSQVVEVAHSFTSKLNPAHEVIQLSSSSSSSSSSLTDMDTSLVQLDTIGNTNLYSSSKAKVELEINNGTKNQNQPEQAEMNNQLILYNEKSVCGFCSVELKEREGIMIDYCLHVFCRDCLVASIELQEGVQIKCPIHEESGCEGFLLEKEIKALVPFNMYQKFLERSMALARKDMNSFQCKTPQCVGWCEYETGRKTFVCFICDKTNCLECQAMHEPVDCTVYQNCLQNAAASGKDCQELLNKERRTGWAQLQKLIGSDRQSLGAVMHNLNKDVYVTTADIECPICMSEIPAGEGIILQDCLHTFCKNCLIDMVKYSEDPEIKCPHIDGNFSCTNYLKPREIKSIVPLEIHEKFLTKSVKLCESAMANSYHCKSMDCPGWCEIDILEGAGGEFHCLICNKRNCINCKGIHEGVSCDDYKNKLVQSDNDKLSEDALNKMVTNGECMRCPKCKTVVQKAAGCDWMVCTACRTELCWATKGPRWGPLGKGDISAGCKCQFITTGGRVKCAPHCMNCH